MPKQQQTKLLVEEFFQDEEFFQCPTWGCLHPKSKLICHSPKSKIWGLIVRGKRKQVAAAGRDW